YVLAKLFLAGFGMSPSRTDQKRGVRLLDLDQQLYPPNRKFFRSRYYSFSIWINAMWGLAPTRLASTYTQKQGENKKPKVYVTFLVFYFNLNYMDL
ncbi:hypothetical protein, partial [Bacillus sp. LK2]|uniref:hypothetical protein n=1 Tax=Bacillus sp. LK2 TaxID=1628206 RepID=UPI000653E7BF